MAEWRRVNVRPIAAYSLQAHSKLLRLQLGLRDGDHTAPAHIHSSDPSKISMDTLQQMIELLLW